QQRQDSIGSYGNPHAITPNIDKLASEGTKFNQFFVQNPVCSPSRMSFLTGRYCSSLGIGMNGLPFPDDALTSHQLFKPYGYDTGQIGKLHFYPTSNRDHRMPYPEQYGFDTFVITDDNGCYEDAYIKWVETLQPDMVDKVWTCPPPAAIKQGVPNRTNR